MGSSKKERESEEGYIDCAKRRFVCVSVVLCAYRDSAMKR
jgi:hypothetical protein